jgi:hypothetical protein
MIDHTPDTAVDTPQWTVTFRFNVWSETINEYGTPVTYREVAKRAAEQIEEWAADGYLERAVYRVEADSIPTMRLDIDLEEVQS